MKFLSKNKSLFLWFFVCVFTFGSLAICPSAKAATRKVRAVPGGDGGPVIGQPAVERTQREQIQLY